MHHVSHTVISDTYFRRNVAPTVDDDTTTGVIVGHRWLDQSVSPAREYLCEDVTEGAAVWTVAGSGGAAAVKLDDLLAPDNNTDLNVSTSAHGLTPRLSGNATEFLNGLGGWTAAGGGTLHYAEAYMDANAGFSGTVGGGAQLVLDYSGISSDVDHAISKPFGNWQYLAPVTGPYIISASLDMDYQTWDDLVSRIMLNLHINGSGASGRVLDMAGPSTTGSTYLHINGMTSCVLAAGDYFDLRIENQFPTAKTILQGVTTYLRNRLTVFSLK